MELIEIAQLVTGIATLIVALILVYQLRQQHKDADSSMSFQAVNLHNENQRWFSENFSNESIEKMKIGLSNLDEKDQNKLRALVHSSFMTIATEFRLGRRNRLRDYYKYAIERFSLLKYKASREILEGINIQTKNSKAVRSELNDLIREVLDDYKNNKIGV
tara:strand:+ start:1414 stop:1896 length:483 start_codon:yes stop_codon:yes gene_type:complete